MIGEDESGFLPSANMFLGGIEGHHGWGKDAVNWYLEAHDTRTNMSRTNIAIPTISIKMVTTSRVTHSGMLWGAMVNSLRVS
jgi:hypothetical protein